MSADVTEAAVGDGIADPVIVVIDVGADVGADVINDVIKKGTECIHGTESCSVASGGYWQACVRLVKVRLVKEIH